MDPDANLDEIREIIERSKGRDYGVSLNEGERLAELIVALDEFLSKGGFLPTTWQQASAAKGDRVFKLPPHQ